MSGMKPPALSTLHKWWMLRACAVLLLISTGILVPRYPNLREIGTWSAMACVAASMVKAFSLRCGRCRWLVFKRKGDSGSFGLPVFVNLPDTCPNCRASLKEW
jgi:hypothetical protein